MKKIIILSFVVLFLFLSGCSTQADDKQNQPQDIKTTTEQPKQPDNNLTTDVQPNVTNNAPVEDDLKEPSNIVEPPAGSESEFSEFSTITSKTEFAASECDVLTSQDLKVKCINLADENLFTRATNQKDKNLCEKISDDELKNECMSF